MKKISTSFLITVLILSTIMIVEIRMASGSEPSIPEFSVRYVDYSYDIPPSYGTDPYNGQTVMTYSGDHIYNKTIEITIRNQPFTQSGDINLYYNVRIKGYYEESWRQLFGVSCDGMTPDAGNYRIQNYASQTTFIRYTLPWDTPSSGRIDIQVQALVGTPIISSNCRILFSEYSYSFNGTKSGWSNTQTLTFGNSAATESSPNLTANPSVSTPTMAITPAPAENSTVVPQQLNTESSKAFGFGLSLEQIAILVLSLLVALLFTIVVVLAKKRVHKENG